MNTVVMSWVFCGLFQLSMAFVNAGSALGGNTFSLCSMMFCALLSGVSFAQAWHKRD